MNTQSESSRPASHTEPCEWTRLLRRARLGDQSALTQLLTQLLVALPAMLRRLPGAAWLPSLNLDIDDIVQEILLRVATRHHRYDPTKCARTWIWTIARNCLIDALRKRNRGTTTLIDDNIADDALGPCESLILSEEAENHACRLNDALAANDDLKRAWHLLVEEEKTYAEAAETLGVPAGTLASRLFRARKLMRAS